MPTLKGNDLYEVMAAKLQQLFATWKITAFEYAQNCLKRVRVVDKYLEAVMAVNPDAE